MFDSLFRKLPSFKGKQRLANLFIKREFPYNQDVLIKGKFGCSIKVPNIKDNIGFEVFVNGVYEKEAIDFMISEIPQQGTVVDIGANIGTIIVPVCKMRSDIRAIAIEASPRVFNYLEFNTTYNKLTNCTIINKAVTDHDDATIPFYSPVEQFGIGCMAPGFTDTAEMIGTTTMDSLLRSMGIKKVDFIKIDIEGYEYFAFKGAEVLLSSPDAPVILFEFAAWAEDIAEGIIPGDAQRLLTAYGYNLFQIDTRGNTSPLLSPLTKGTAMLLASKQKI